MSGDRKARSLSITRELGIIKDVAGPIWVPWRDLIGIMRPYLLNLSMLDKK